ncbi:MAG: hypothetical protein ACFFD4_01500 [Candidatus Odinarchaeota archaeon]
MSKKICPNCQTVVPEDSSYCANCGGEIPNNPSNPATGTTTRITGGELAETLMKTGDYLWPKIVLVLFASVPVISVFGIMIIGTSSISNMTSSAGAGFADSAGIVVITFILSVIAVITSIIAYKTYKILLEQQS